MEIENRPDDAIIAASIEQYIKDHLKDVGKELVIKETGVIDVAQKSSSEMVVDNTDPVVVSIAQYIKGHLHGNS